MLPSCCGSGRWLVLHSLLREMIRKQLQTKDRLSEGWPSVSVLPLKTDSSSKLGQLLFSCAHSSIFNIKCIFGKSIFTSQELNM